MQEEQQSTTTFEPASCTHGKRLTRAVDNTSKKWRCSFGSLKPGGGPRPSITLEMFVRCMTSKSSSIVWIKLVDVFPGRLGTMEVAVMCGTLPSTLGIDGTLTVLAVDHASCTLKRTGLRKSGSAHYSIRRNGDAAQRNRYRTLNQSGTC